MTKNIQLIDYVSQQRWCGFKKDIADGNVTNITLDSIPFDEGEKALILGEASLADGSKKMFFMPMAKGKSYQYQSVIIDGVEMFDALKTPDYWEKLMNLFREKSNKVVFGNGNIIKYKPIGSQEVVAKNLQSESKSLNVEQSNTTIKVGDAAIAFKQDRMIESDFGVSTEVEMNDKLMQEDCDAMPKTYGAFLMKEPSGKVATIGIVQEFVPNKGDLWEYANAYLINALRQAKSNGFDTVEAEEHKSFIALMENLGKKADNMSQALSKPNGDPNFEPEIIDEKYLMNYGKSFKVLLYQTREKIAANIQSLDGEAKSQAENLLENWDGLTDNFVNGKINFLKNTINPGKIVRGHGDFHLGQVLVTKNDDLKVLDFAGEPGASIVERKKKHPETRDDAGMYRSISGYLGPVVAESFAATGEMVKRANGSDKKVTDSSEEKWANRVVAPIIEAATKAFMRGKSEKQPLMALEILRKNLYEVSYEVANRPDMAHIPIKGLVGLLSGAQQQNQQDKQGSKASVSSREYA